MKTWLRRLFGKDEPTRSGKANEPVSHAEARMEWTDDLSLPLVQPKTVDELVDFIIDNRRKMGRLQILTTLAIRFGLTFEDARLALDRVGGGETRCDCDGGRKGRNRPDPIKDPIACASYDRRRGIPAPVLPPRGTSAWRRWLDVIRSGDVKRAAVGIGADATQTERIAAEIWVKAVQGIGSTNGTGDVDLAIALVELAVATPESTITEWQRSNVLLAAGSWLETANRACQRRPEYKAYCIEWFDAVRIAEAAAELAASADRTGNTDYAGMSLDLRRRITARMLAEPARVGIAMLDCIAFERRAGKTDDVAALCDAVVADFRTVVESCEEVSDPPFDEDQLALCQIVEVVKIRREICGPNPVDEELCDRCQALLARNDFS